MAEVIGYIVSNYTWILIGSILILLAFIGKYADETNFGQGKAEIESPKEKIALETTGLEDYVNSFCNKNNNNKNDFSENLNKNDNSLEEKENLNEEELISDGSTDLNNSVDTSVEIQKNDMEEPETEKLETNDNSDTSNYDNSKEKAHENQRLNNFEEEFEKFDEEFDLVLPKKEIINDGLLDDIENLSLDSPKSNIYESIPELDDVELPKIKKMETEDDPWKF